MNVGFIGLGGMGRGMARRLLAAGHSVQVWNRSPAPVEALVAEGATPAASVAEIFGNEVVISMLADDTAVESVLLDGELLAGATASVHVNMATVSPGLARRATELHAEHGIGYVAAPVLGRTDVAAAGNLNILVAGADSDITRVVPLFDAMGRKTWRLGEQPHLANVAKVCANFTLVSAIEAIAEAITLAEANGLAAGDLVEILSNTFLPGPISSVYGAMIAEDQYEPANFRMVLGLKDVGLVLDTGTASRVPLPLAGLLRDALLESIAHGDADRDLAALGANARRRAGRQK